MDLFSRLAAVVATIELEEQVEVRIPVSGEVETGIFYRPRNLIYTRGGRYGFLRHGVPLQT